MFHQTYERSCNVGARLGGLLKFKERGEGGDMKTISEENFELKLNIHFILYNENPSTIEVLTADVWVRVLISNGGPCKFQKST